MECKITGITKFYCDGKLVGATNYNGNAFANPHIEITEEDIAMGYKDAGDEIVKAWHNFDDYLKRHPEIWQSLADKLWDGFVDYKNIPFGNKDDYSSEQGWEELAIELEKVHERLSHFLNEYDAYMEEMENKDNNYNEKEDDF